MVVGKIDLDGEIGIELAKQLNLLYGTPEGSIPLNRDFGLNMDFLSLPPDAAENLYALEVMEKTERYIPEVVVDEVNFSYPEDGRMCPTIRLKLSEEEDLDNE